MCKLADIMKPLSPTELAAQTNISVPYASQILSGKRRASAALARLIEEKAGIPKHLLRSDIFDAPSGGGAAGCAPAPGLPSDGPDTANPDAETPATADDAPDSMDASSAPAQALSCGSAAKAAPQQVNGGRPC